MNVLCHGIPFCCDWTPLERYCGRHDIRSIGNHPSCRYRYDFHTERWPDILRRIQREWSPELVLVWVPELHPPPQGIEDSPIPTVAMVSDWNVYYAVLNKNLARYDLVLCDKPGVPVFSSPSVRPHYLMPLYSQISGIHRRLPVEKDIDILFVGNLNHAAHPRRGKLLERIARLSRKYRVVIATNYVGDAYAHLLNRARIVFNHSIRGELNLRVFETMACGGAPWIEADNAEARDWFENDTDIVLYTEDDLEKRIAEYLDRPEKLERVCAAASARAHEFAGEARFDALIEWASAQRCGDRAFHGFDEIEKRYQDLLQYGFSRWDVYYPAQSHSVTHLAKDAPTDPRVWTAVARHMLDPRTPMDDPAQRPRRVLTAARHAVALQPDSAARALNVASLCRTFQMHDDEERTLHEVLNANAIDGAEEVLGTHADAFWARWAFAVATKSAHVGLLHAEAHARLAVVAALQERLDESAGHLVQARELDPRSVQGARLHTEILWQTGRRDEAVVMLHDAIAQIPFEFEGRKRLVQMLIELGRDTEATHLNEDTALLRRALGS